MKKLIIPVLVFSMAMAFAACNSKSTNKQETAEENSMVSTTLSVDDLLADAESMAGETVTVEGVCTHICSHGGKKIFLMGSDDTQTLRVESTDQTGAFSQNSVNSVVSVTGKLVEERIDEAFLAQWEAETKAGTLEQHGEGEEAGCSSEQQAQGESPVNTMDERIANFRSRIAQEKEKTGKEYLSFYHVEAESYEIL